MGACIFIIFIGMSSALVNSMGIYPTIPVFNTAEAEGVINTAQNLVSTWSGLISLTAGITIVVIIGLSFFAGSINTNLLAAAMFAVVFWATWGYLQLSMFAPYGFYTGILLSLMLMLNLGMIIMFIGAVIGILGVNTNEMRL